MKASSLIPRLLPNRLFLWGAGLLRALRRLRCRLFPGVWEADAAAGTAHAPAPPSGETASSQPSAAAVSAAMGAGFSRAADPATGYLEDQHALTGFPFGRTRLDRSGCGVIAAYNALHQLCPDAPAGPDALLAIRREILRDGMLWNGRLGTAPQSLAAFLRRRGFTVRTARSLPRAAELARTCPCLILTVYNDRTDLSEDIHTIHIEKSAAGLTAHNALLDGSVLGPYPDLSSLLAALHGGRSRLICLLGVSGPQGKPEDRAEQVAVHADR